MVNGKFVGDVRICLSIKPLGTRTIIADSDATEIIQSTFNAIVLHTR